MIRLAGLATTMVMVAVATSASAAELEARITEPRDGTWVIGEVEIIAVGDAAAVARFAAAVIDEAPPLSSPVLAASDDVDVPTTDGFVITSSAADAGAQVFVPPDYFMCDDCRRELQDPHDRRYAYPFINCTQCGPRYTLIEALPYDRPNTSMAGFPLCPDCEAEYLDPADRRFHAEPVACPACGPRLSFEQRGGVSIDDTGAALERTVTAIRDGHIVAIKGVGGYHLICDALNESAVRRLRERKQRPGKPLAVMFPLAGDDGLSIARQYVDFDTTEAEIVTGPMRPIVLVRRRADSGLAPAVAPGLDEIGVFLPYSPMHQLLLDGVEGPVVATSGNISGEPVLTDNAEARRRLEAVADGFLQHNRPIVRPADDPVFRRIGNALRPLRIGRGCAPRELQLPWRQHEPLLAVGGHMKGTVALSFEDRVVVSPHIGEMDRPRSLDVFERVAQDLQALYGVEATRIACDAHPGYTTRRWAERQELPLETVWNSAGKATGSCSAGTASAWGETEHCGAAKRLSDARQPGNDSPACGHSACRVATRPGVSRGVARLRFTGSATGPGLRLSIGMAWLARRGSGTSTASPRLRRDDCSMRRRRSFAIFHWQAMKRRGR